MLISFQDKLVEYSEGVVNFKLVINNKSLCEIRKFCLMVYENMFKQKKYCATLDNSNVNQGKVDTKLALRTHRFPIIISFKVIYS